MRLPYCRIASTVVRFTAREALQEALSWRDDGQFVCVGKLLDLLLLAAALASSLSAVVRRFRFGFSHETARKAVAANLPGIGSLADGLVDALNQTGMLPRSPGDTAVRSRFFLRRRGPRNALLSDAPTHRTEGRDSTRTRRSRPTFPEPSCPLTEATGVPIFICVPPPSSRGLGRSPLKAKTGVRFPLGVHERNDR